MADVKDQISPQSIEAMARDFAAVWPAFDVERFTGRAVDGLDELALMARVRHVARALSDVLPVDPEHAAGLVRAALGAGGLASWTSLAVGEYIAVTMLDRPDLALPLLAEITPRFSAEFAIRPFIDAHVDTTMRQLHEWVEHPDEHVRRLVSEGSRPRLPWGTRLQGLIADPSPTVELLDRLFDDDSEYVRRSVANHLNDIAKDHPALAVEVAERWLPASTHGDFVIRHALRSLVKRGDPAALAVLGFGGAESIRLVELRCEPERLSIGDELTFEFTLVADTDTAAVIDYVVHYQGAKGRKPGKVFKLVTRQLAAGEPVTVRRRHRFAHVSIRTIRPGAHRIEVQANGAVLGGVEFDVVD